MDLVPVVTLASIYPLVIGRALKEGHYVYINAGATVVWALVFAVLSIWQTTKTPYQMSRSGYLWIGIAGLVGVAFSLANYRAIQNTSPMLFALSLVAGSSLVVVPEVLFWERRLPLGGWICVAMIIAGAAGLIYFKNQPID